MLKMIERGFFKSPAIKLSDSNIGPGGLNPPVQLLRVGKFKHPEYGDFEITSATLAEMKKNFDKKIRGVDVAFDYFHDSDKEASGWPTELYLSEDMNELWAKVDWTPKAQKKLSEREIRYFSPDFAFQWQDPETGVLYKNVLFGGGLTNRPFVKDMAAIVASEKKQGGIMNEEELKKLQAAVLKLSEDSTQMKADNEAMKKKLAEYEEKAPAAADPAEGESDDPAVLKKLLAEANKKLEEMSESHKKLLAEKASAEEAKKMAEKTNSFNVLLTEGKACAAQKDAFMKGDMDEFLKLSQPVNLSGKGSTNNPVETTGDDDRADKILKLAEEKRKADPKLSKVDAISLAQKEVK